MCGVRNDDVRYYWELQTIQHLPFQRCEFSSGVMCCRQALRWAPTLLSHQPPLPSFLSLYAFVSCFFAAYVLGILGVFCAIINDPEEPARAWKDFITEMGNQREPLFEQLNRSKTSIILMRGLPLSFAPSLLCASLNSLPVRAFFVFLINIYCF